MLLFTAVFLKLVQKHTLSDDLTLWDPKLALIRQVYPSGAVRQWQCHLLVYWLSRSDVRLLHANDASHCTILRI